MSQSARRDDLLGSDAVGPVDEALTDEPAVVGDRVGGRAGAAGSGSLGDLPLDVEGVAGLPAGATLDGTGDDPRQDEMVGILGFADDGGSRVLDPDRVDAVDDVGPGEAISHVDLRTGKGAGGDEDGDHRESSEDPSHAAPESIDVNLPPWAKRTLIGLAVVLAAVLAFAVFEPIQVLPRIRLAPGFTMVDQSGSNFTSEDGRGAVTLYTFTYGDCGEECASTNQTMSEIATRAADEVDTAAIDLRLVTVSFDAASDAGRLGELATASGADGDLWRWAALAPEHVETVVGSGFRVYVDEQADGGFEFDQTFVLVDGWGVIRGEYQYATLASDADRILRHIGVLEEEIRNSHGVASFAYEAAHVFLCYP